jgi:hypothetical protein
MSAHSSGEWLLVCCTTLVVVFLAITFKRQFWEAPLNHGPRYFLGVEVSLGFYEGEGIRWLRRYHTLCLAVLSIEALGLLAILVSGRWSLLPLWAGGTGVLLPAAFLGFTGYTRRTLGANRPVLSSVAIPLEARRLGDYISWPAEALITVITALSWVLLRINGDALVHWQAPVVITYVIVGLFPFKIGIVRNSIPLPTERPEEHLRFMEASRRYSLRVMDAVRWFLLVILGGYGLLHGWRMAGAEAWLRWSLVGIALAIWVVLVVIITREGRRLTGMGRGLRPIGSWSTPFRPARLSTPDIVPFAAWFAGLVLLLIFFRG